jgi:hypothetical protein
MSNIWIWTFARSSHPYAWDMNSWGIQPSYFAKMPHHRHYIHHIWIGRYTARLDCIEQLKCVPKVENRKKKIAIPLRDFVDHIEAGQHIFWPLLAASGIERGGRTTNWQREGGGRGWSYTEFSAWRLGCARTDVICFGAAFWCPTFAPWEEKIWGKPHNNATTYSLFQNIWCFSLILRYMYLDAF